MAKGGQILAEVLQQVIDKVQPGISTKELNDLAEKLIIAKGGQPAFKNYKTHAADRTYPTTLCTSINQEVVHAPAIPDRILKEGDLLGLDIGIEYQGYFTDMAKTIAIGEISTEAKKLLAVTQEALQKGIEQFKAGNFLADMGKTIQDYVEENGLSIVRELVGHGIGKKVHEDPKVANYLTEESKSIKIKPGMTLAIEPMVNLGAWQVELLEDGWTFVTRDKSLSAQFEHTVALDHEGKTRILTQ